MRIFDSLDGGYTLSTPTWAGEDPPIPDSNGLQIGSEDDIVCITTLNEWHDVRVDVIESHGRFTISGPSGWEAVAETTVNVSGPMHVTDLEFEPHGKPIDLAPGTYLVQVFARSADSVGSVPQLQIDDRPMEQHLVYLSPVQTERRKRPRGVASAGTDESEVGLNYIGTSEAGSPLETALFRAESTHRDTARLRPELKRLDLDPDPSTLAADPAEFALSARLIVGSAGSPDEESFDVTVCTPEWLAQRCRDEGGIYDPRHHLVVTFDTFDQRKLRAWLEARVRSLQGDDWPQVAEQLSRLGFWEFENYSD